MRLKMQAIEERRQLLMYQMDLQLNDTLPRCEKDIVEMRLRSIESSDWWRKFGGAECKVYFFVNK